MYYYVMGKTEYVYNMHIGLGCLCVMGKLKNGKTAGGDEVVAELVKNGGQAMIDWLWELLKEVWRTKQIPKEWKMPP